MIRQITRIAPWQAGKVFALMYLVIGFVFAVPMYFFVESTRVGTGEPALGIGLFIAMPLIYAIAALIFVPLFCLLYNATAKFTGGIELSVTEKAT